MDPTIIILENQVVIMEALLATAPDHLAKELNERIMFTKARIRGLK